MSLHAEKPVMITCDRGAWRLASSGYKYGAERAPSAHPFLLLLAFFLATRRSHGSKEILGRGERKGPQVGADSPWPSAAEAALASIPRSPWWPPAAMEAVPGAVVSARLLMGARRGCAPS